MLQFEAQLRAARTVDEAVQCGMKVLEVLADAAHCVGTTTENMRALEHKAALKERTSFRRKGIRHSLDGQEAGGTASAGQADEGDSEDWDD